MVLVADSGRHTHRHSRQRRRLAAAAAATEAAERSGAAVDLSTSTSTYTQGAGPVCPPPSRITVLDLRILVRHMQAAGTDWSIAQFVGTVYAPSPTHHAARAAAAPV